MNTTSPPLFEQPHHHYQDNNKDETESTASMSSLSWNGEEDAISISQQARSVVLAAEQEQQYPWRRQQPSMVVARRCPIFPSSSSPFTRSSSASPFHINNKHNNTVVIITKATKYTLSPTTINKQCSPMNRPPWMMNENLPFLSSKAVFHLHLKRPAITIQAAVRGMLQRLRYRQLLIVTKFSPAATIIQTTMRAKLQRIRFHAFCQELLKEYHATNIQKWFRGTHLRRRIEHHYSALVIQGTGREWLTTCIRPRRHVLVLQCAHNALIQQEELRKIDAYKQREMIRIRAQVEAEFATAAAKGEKIVVGPTAEELRLQAVAAENYQMIEYLHAEHVKLQHHEKKLTKGIATRLAEQQKLLSCQSQDDIDMMNDIATLKNIIIPRMQHNVEMGTQVAKEWQDQIQETQNQVLEYDLRTISEQRVGMIILSYMQQVVETVDEYDAADSSKNINDNDNDDYDDENQQELAYFVKKLALQVEFLQSRKNDTAPNNNNYDT